MRVCNACEAPIPTKPRDDLIALGYTGVQFGNKTQFVFCPKHPLEEVSKFIESKIVIQRK